MQASYTHATLTKLRREPRADSEVLCELTKGTPVEVHEKVDQYFRVTVQQAEDTQLTGFVHVNFLTETVSKEEEKVDSHVRCGMCGSNEWSVLTVSLQKGRRATPYSRGGFRVTLRCPHQSQSLPFLWFLTLLS